MSTVNINGLKYQSGDRISCHINDNFIKEAILHIHNGGKNMYICHSENSCDGERSPDLHGHRRSWTFSQDESGLTDGVSNIVPLSLSTFEKKDIKVSDDLRYFFEMNEISYFLDIMGSKIGIFDDYVNFNFSENMGFIKMSTNNNTKVLEMRFGRFLKKLMSNFTKSCPEKNSLTDVFVESLFNKYTSFSQKDSYSVEFLIGKDILKGYTRDNQLEITGTSLSGSCMNNKLEYLKVYTENDSIVQLAVIYDENKKIIARTLIWNVNCKILHDKIYVAKNWLFNFFRTKLKELDIEDIYDNKYKSIPHSIQLVNWKFEEYPYLDTFSVFDPEKGRLHFNPKESKPHYHNLRYQDGRPNLFPTN